MTQSVHRNEKLLYTARTHTVGGRDHGAARSADGQLEVRLSPPGSGRPGANPEQLFAAGWSACFEGALAHVARLQKLKLPAEPEINAEVDLNLADDGFLLRARLNVALPGLDRDIAQALVDAAHQACPYSKATRGNIDVEVNLV